jgi:tetratricopeptide (TPR) repeat protein
MHDEFLNIYFMLGLSYMQTRKYVEAEDVFFKGLQKFPKVPDLYFFMGNLLQQQQRHEDAINYLQVANKLEPQNVQTLWTLAASFEAMKKYKESDELYQTALEIRPDDPLILNNYAYSLSERGERLEEALEMSKVATQKEPENGAYLDTIGWIYYKMGRYEMALEFVKKAIQIRNDSAEVHEHLGEIYYKLNNFENARLSWEKALQLDESRSWLKEKLKENAR